MAVACETCHRESSRRSSSLPQLRPSRPLRQALVSEPEPPPVPSPPVHPCAVRGLLSWSFLTDFAIASAQRLRLSLEARRSSPLNQVHGISSSFPVVLRPSNSRWARCASASG